MTKSFRSTDYIYYKYNESPKSGDIGVTYLSKIEYNNDMTRSVEFVLEDKERHDAIKIYDQGCAVRESRRLKEILVKADNRIVRKYALKYFTDKSSSSLSITTYPTAESPESPLSLLQSITQFGSNDIALPPTEFEYNPHVVERWYDDDHEQDWFFRPRDGSLHLGGTVTLSDVNRDGMPDIVKGNQTVQGNAMGWWIWQNTGSKWLEEEILWEVNGFSFPINSHEFYPILGDHDRVILSDINGDGLPDIVKGHKYDGWWVWLNTGKGWSNKKIKWENNNSAQRTYPYLSNDNVTLTDVNGDGLPDIVKGYKYDGWWVWLNTKEGWKNDKIMWLEKGDTTPSLNQKYVFLSDVNGDSLPDIVTRAWEDGNKYRWRVRLNTGDRWENKKVMWFESTEVVSTSNPTDINGDGLPDIFTYGYEGNYDGHFGYYQSFCYVRLNIGEEWTNEVVKWINKSEPSFPGFIRSIRTDANGDGLIDIVSSNLEFFYESNYSLHFNNRWLVRLNEGHAPYLLSKIKNSLGGKTTIEYTYSTRFDNTGNDDISDLGFPLNVVKTVGKDNQMPGDHHTSATYYYNYSGGLYDYEDKEFRGFSNVTVTNSLGTKEDHEFHQDDVLKGKEYKTLIKDKRGKPYRKTENIWAYSEADGVFQPSLEQTLEYTYDGVSENPKETRVRYTYDMYGNVITAIYNGEIEKTGDERIIQKQYVYNTDLWILDKPSETALTDSESAYLKRAWYAYDNQGVNTPPIKGDMTEEIVWLDTGEYPKNSYSYDDYGNVISSTNARGFVTQYVYDDKTHTFPEKTINAVGHATVQVFDMGTGNQLSATDSNGFTVTNEYDTFGRIIKKIQPYDTSSFPTVQYQYNADGVVPEAVKVSKRMESGENGRTVNVFTFIDGFGRAVQTQENRLDPRKKIAAYTSTVTNTYYNEIGKLRSQSVPHFRLLSPSAGKYTTPQSGIKTIDFEYDAIGRNIVIRNPDGTFKQAGYDHWKITITDENGHSKVNHLNAYGKIIQIDEQNEGQTYITRYVYNAKDELITITDSQENIFSFEYDSLGREILHIDPDIGTWRYEYDPTGNMISQKDNRDIVTNFRYDELNRILRVEYPSDNDIDYVYDLETTGTLSQISDGVGKTHYFYDQRLRTIKEEKTVDQMVWTTEWTYNANNSIESVKYPDGEIVLHNYNDRGFLSSVADIIIGIYYNDFGSITGKKFANAISTTLSYNDNFRLKEITTQYIDDKQLQDMRYDYDNAGNVISIEDALENRGYLFQYDDLDRLIAAREDDGYNFTYEYDSIGNLMKVDDSTHLIEYFYGVGAGPHAVTSVTGLNVDTDQDGLLDDLEDRYCTVSTDADTDDDGINDGIEDANQNGVVDTGETDPCNVDTDGDGTQDGTELGYTLDSIGPDTDINIFKPDTDPSSTTDPLDPSDAIVVEWPKNMVGYWQFDETDDDTATDSGNYSNHGLLLNSPQWLADKGRIEGAIKFDGTDDYVKVPHSDSLLFQNNQLSVMFWMKADSFPVTSSVGDIIISKTDYAGGKWEGFYVDVRRGENNNGRLRLVSGACPENYKFWTMQVPQGQWTHVAFTIDENECKLYINGKLSDTVATNSEYTISNNRQLHIGAYENGDYNYKGLIDDLRIYNYALSKTALANAAFSNNHKGDINGDGVVGLDDAIVAINVLVGIKPSGIRSDYVTSGADVNGDCRVGSEEVLYILEVVSEIR